MNWKSVNKHVKKAKSARELDKALAVLYNEFFETDYTFRYAGAFGEVSANSASEEDYAEFLQRNEEVQSFMAYDMMLREMAREHDDYEGSGFQYRDWEVQAMKESDLLK